MSERPSLSLCFNLARGMRHAFLALRLATGPLWIAGLLMSISDGCESITPFDFSKLGDIGRNDDQFQLTAAAAPAFELDSELVQWVVGLALVFVLVGVAIWLALFALNAFITTGAARMNLALLERGDATTEALFSGRDRFWAMVGYRALTALTATAVMLATAWPGALLAYYGYATESDTLITAGIGFACIFAVPALAYVMLGNYLGELAVALDKASPAHALRQSWRLAQGERLPLLGFALVCWIIQLVASFGGLLLCCVGALATVPFTRGLIAFAKLEGYVLLTRGFAQAPSYRLWERDAEENLVRSPAMYGPSAQAPVQPPQPQPPAAPANDDEDPRD